MFTISEAWRKAFPTAKVGIMLMSNVINPAHRPENEKTREEVQTVLRARFSRLFKADLDKMGPVQAFDAYYKRFNRIYDIRYQLETVLFQDRSMVRVNPVTEVVFTNDVKNMLLTSSHDADMIKRPMVLDIAGEGNRYVVTSGKDFAIPKGDMLIRDSRGPISSLIGGGDYNTRVTAATKRVLFFLYGPSGISEALMYHHLFDIHAGLRRHAPNAEINYFRVLKT